MARRLVRLSAAWWGRPCRGTKRVYLGKRRLAIAIVARQPAKSIPGGGDGPSGGEGGTFRTSLEGRKSGGTSVRIEARTGRERELVTPREKG